MPPRPGPSARENVVTVGSSVLFNAPGTELHSNLGRGAEAWAGYKQAVKVRCAGGWGQESCNAAGDCQSSPGSLCDG